MLTRYEAEKLLRRVEQGVTTVRDAEVLRAILLGDTPTASVAKG